MPAAAKVKREATCEWVRVKGMARTGLVCLRVGKVDW